MNDIVEAVGLAVMAGIVKRTLSEAEWTNASIEVRSAVIENVGISALKAMREPTIPMALAGWRALQSVASFQSMRGDTPDVCYRAMIDEALKDA